jgi:hypothetical protein
MKLTITEALAEIKTITKRLEKKRQFVASYLLRAEAAKDPLEKDGGTPLVLARESQAIVDLETRIVAIRTGIQQANHRIAVTVSGQTKMLAEWLTWRKEVAPGRQSFLDLQRRTIVANRQNFQKQLNANPDDIGLKMGIAVQVDEGALAKDAETIETILGALDGQLSLKNATEFIELPD